MISKRPQNFARFLFLFLPALTFFLFGLMGNVMLARQTVENLQPAGSITSKMPADQPMMTKSQWVNALMPSQAPVTRPGNFATATSTHSIHSTHPTQSTLYSTHSIHSSHPTQSTPYSESSLSIQSTPYSTSSRLDQAFLETPALAFLSSGLMPGSAQATQKNWLRAGAFFLIEAASIYLVLDYQQRGTDRRNSYEAFADQNWSVVQYANWLVEYHDVNNLNNPNLDALRNLVEGLEPAWNTTADWSAIDIQILRAVERNTPYVTTDNLYAANFSHILPAYGSQQYYELIAKYYQFQAGWRDYINSDWRDYYFDYPVYQIDRSGGNASPLFFEGALLADQFNNDFRKAGTYTLLLIGNHIVSAFDAYFSYTLEKNRATLAAGVLPGRQLSLKIPL